MKKFLILGMAMALALSVAPAMAASQGAASGDTPATFRALSNLPSVTQATLTPMTDQQLASVEGGFFVIAVGNFVIGRQSNHCFICGNVRVKGWRSRGGSRGVHQANYAYIHQNFGIRLW